MKRCDPSQYVPAPGHAFRVDAIGPGEGLVYVGGRAARFHVCHEPPPVLPGQLLERWPPVVRVAVADQDESVRAIDVAVEARRRRYDASGYVAAVRVRCGKC